jgi:hypothetical protein
MTRHGRGISVLAIISIFLASGVAFAAQQFTAAPFEFVGTVENCGADGVDTVVAEWRKGIGLADDKGVNNYGLFIVKAGPTSNCVAAGASIKGVNNVELVEVGFDIRSDSHCGAGAPRINVQADDGSHFLGGCVNASQQADTPEPGWTRVRIDPSDPAQAFPPLTAGAKVSAIDILFDEGSDQGEGFAVLDNIQVKTTKGEVIITKPGPAK